MLKASDLSGLTHQATSTLQPESYRATTKHCFCNGCFLNGYDRYIIYLKRKRLNFQISPRRVQITDATLNQRIVLNGQPLCLTRPKATSLNSTQDFENPVLASLRTGKETFNKPNNQNKATLLPFGKLE